MAYVFNNPNPRGIVTNDCIVRAVANATDTPWSDIMNDLCETAKEIYNMPNNFETISKYMASKGHQNHTILSADACTVAEFCEKHPYGRYVILTPDHSLAVVGGDYIDVTDCGNSPVTDYWEIKC